MCPLKKQMDRDLVPFHLADWMVLARKWRGGPFYIRPLIKESGLCPLCISRLDTDQSISLLRGYPWTEKVDSWQSPPHVGRVLVGCSMLCQVNFSFFIKLFSLVLEPRGFIELWVEKGLYP